LSEECGWDWDVGGMEGVWTGSGSAVRVVAGLSNLIGVGGSLSRRSGRMEAHPRAAHGCAKSYFP
jgi:hypothetical protein